MSEQQMFVPLAPEDIPNIRESRRGRISYPIVKSFIESHERACIFNPPASLKQTKSGMASLLKYYTQKHKLPVEVVYRGGQIYLIRVDILADGTFDPNWVYKEEPRRARPEAITTSGPTPELTPEEVMRKIQEGADDITR